MITLECAVLDGETVYLSLRNKLNQNQLLLFTNQSLVKHTMDATKIKVIETFQNYSEKDMVTLENASKWPWMEDSNTLVCNMLANVGSVIRLANMERDQIKNAICHARKTIREPAVLDGEIVSSN